MKDDKSPVGSFVLLILVFMIVALMGGCANPPVIPKFPEAPVKAGATEKCPDLKKLEEGAKLSEISKVIADNYGSYYDCSMKVDIWIDWYNTNKANYDKIGK